MRAGLAVYKDFCSRTEERYEERDLVKKILKIVGKMMIRRVAFPAEFVVKVVGQQAQLELPRRDLELHRQRI